MTTRLLLALLLLPTIARATDANYKPGPEAEPQADVPKGALTKHRLETSQVFPDTFRDFWVYVPAGAKPGAALPVMVFFDGHWYIDPKAAVRVPIVLDNLIAKRDIPAIAAVFVNPGAHKDKQPPDGKWRADNRSFEYDTLHDLNARFVIDELLPAAEKASGATFSKDPDARAICGMSSGGIAAFTVAWERPDAFRKVVSHIGSFTGIAYRPGKDGQPLRPGGDLYPTLIRKTPVKPLRIFLQDGSNDLDNEHGHWFLANQQMLAALHYANAKADKEKSTGPRYDVHHVWGEGLHSPKHGGMIFPDTLRWIWRDYKTN
ncbi:MAG TPA: alpha/beta hydrolase-fold protein [Tepidisphaeraceae bacterium]|nr:alpha/beta hydrolase-fold protein [Tepidisphaeraceae bacterium]